MKNIFIAFAFSLTCCFFMAFRNNGIKPAGDEKINYTNCTFKGFKLYGKIKVVESFPDVKVKVVESFPDLKVKVVESFPDDCGKWKFVESFPDTKIKFVESFPDVKIKYVDAFPGKP